MAVTRGEANLALWFEDVVPVLCTPLAEPWQPAQRVRADTGNIELLRTMLLLDDGADSGSDENRDSDLQRIESKLNVLLDLVARIFSVQVPLPPAIPLRLSATHVVIRGAGSLLPEQLVALEIYLHTKLPRCIHLLGKVAGDPDEDGNYTIALEPLSQALQDLIEKFIFRQHRRLVAYQRRSPKA